MYVRNIGFLEAARLAFQKYFQFSGRAQRAEYWWFQLFIFVVAIVLAVLDAITFGLSNDGTGLFGSIWSLATVIPTLSLGWRRMHDIGKSGWWNLLPLAPVLWTIVAAVILFESSDTSNAIAVIAMILGGFATLASVIYVIVLSATDSDPHDNQFGFSVKYNPRDDVF